jgi:hypothetical protein
MLKTRFNSHNFKNNPRKQYSKTSKPQSSGGHNISCCQNQNKKNILFQEFLCHLPMAILALCISLLCLTFFDNIISHTFILSIRQSMYGNLFHIAHYIHILCASFGSFYACYNNDTSNYKKTFFTIIFSLINSLLFCTLADIVLPALGGLLLNSGIQIHICFFHMSDIINAFVFSIFGIFSAYCLQNGEKQYSLKIAQKVHLGHVWFGCIASLLYILSQIKIDVIESISILFLILFFSVIIPCVLSDICLPYFFNKTNHETSEYQNKKIDYHN